MGAADRSRSSSHAFGTFGGVFTPSILTILGVIMFMRANFVVGQAGILAALLILLISKSITFLTGLSICAISTNTEVKGGGAYFLISRSLGPEFGGAIGLTLFLAQALSVPFYILGFVESVIRSFPALEAYFLPITLGTALVLFIVTYVGADWAIRVQYVILTVLVISIVTFLAGALQHWNTTTFTANLAPGYSLPKYNFWVIFAIYFPAVTGIMAGVNMSGDLKEPARSIPQGTLVAIGVGLLVYAGEALISGGAYPRQTLIEKPFEVLFQNAVFGMGFLVMAGVFAATISSAIGSFMGAPRILQALARDHIFAPLNLFAVGAQKGDEPRRALWLTLGITLAILLYAGNDVGGQSLNAVAGIISMFFLYTYGITNLAAFIESVTANPSFRPRFRYFHWSTAMLGTVACGATAFLISRLYALVAIVIIGVIFAYVRQRVLSTTFGDARRGFYYSWVRNYLLKLTTQPVHPKNWRPTILVLSGNPNTRLTLVRYAHWLASKRGIVTLAEILPGKLPELAQRRLTALKRLQGFIKENEIQAFPEVVVAPDFDQSLLVLLQSHSIGPIKPNIMLVGWPGDPHRLEPFGHLLLSARALNMSLVCVLDRGLPRAQPSFRIDVWWDGEKNSSLMLILAHLLTLDWEWNNAFIRLWRVVEDEAGRESASEALHELLGAGRIPATVEIVVSDGRFIDLVHEHSHDASVVFLGFEVPKISEIEVFHQQCTKSASGLPTTLLVYSSGDADLMT